MKKNLCITYESTGKYNIFFKDFYRSFDMNFCRECNKIFFVFTDNSDELKKQVSDYGNCSNIKFFKIDVTGLSIDEFKFRKFKFLSEAESYYKNYDYCFYFNGNLICKSLITLNELFNGKEQFAVVHSLFDPNSKGKYDSLCQDNRSASYFDARKFQTFKYFQSGNFGATSDRFKKMISYIESCRYYDLYYGYDKYVKWHDETYYNKYINILIRKEPNKINILSGKMYLCTWLPELEKYQSMCKMFLLHKNYFWKKKNL